jgi:hypothetical protein
MSNAEKLDQPTFSRSESQKRRRIAVVIQAEFSHHCSYLGCLRLRLSVRGSQALLNSNLRGFNGKWFDSLSAQVRQPLANGWAAAT